MKQLFAVIALLMLSGCQTLAIVRGPNRNTSRVLVEVDWTTPTPPPQSMLDGLKNKIKSYCDPSVLVEFVLDDHKGSQGGWTDSSLKTFAFSNHDTSDSFYMLWADGVLKDSPAAGGYSWDKRCFAVFPSTSGNQSVLQMAAAHEFFHTLGLVDKALAMVVFHKHSYGNHCNNPSCLMWPVSGNSGLCNDCVADLEAGIEK